MLFSLPTSLVLAAVFWTSSVPAVATASAERVIDLNFEDLDAAVQVRDVCSESQDPGFLATFTQDLA